jgi:geranylgeranyl diphosphate synthase type II
LSIAESIPKYRDDINKGLFDLYPEGPLSLTQPVSYVLRGGGKRIRPLLTIISAEACGGSKDVAFSAALAVEVLHNFTLVHDHGGYDPYP